MAHPQIVRAEIEGIEFTLYYDYDQLQARKLSQLTEDGEIEWFRLRVNYVFLEPLSCLYSGKTPAYRALNSIDQGDLPARSFVIGSFSVLLNGIEALGSFMTAEPDEDKRKNFFAFITTYMKSWNKDIRDSPFPTRDLKTILWEHFRNGIAHGFCIQRGGIDNEADGPRWIAASNYLRIGPNTFFHDFVAGVQSFFSDVRNDPTRRNTFLRRFRRLYPH